ncbi:glycosyltransferase family 2 protein [Haloarchaeobius baliensis]|uniref:glycosyltransferase family 2 protein n=1 Tax=Haloarchaeobius baliensis TaxID=1670458 RepID=UPI003F884680
MSADPPQDDREQPGGNDDTGVAWQPHELAVDTGDGRLDDAESTDESPLVTAVVTTYDRFEEATRAIESVLSQTYEPVEFLVVEDGTESGVEGWLAENGYDSVRYVRHATNQGLSGARNTAIALAEGEYVAFLDDDDSWKPERLERGVAALQSLPADERGRVGVVYCAVEAREDGRVASIVPPENQGNLRAAIVRDGPSTLESSCLFSKRALVDVGGYDEELVSSVDHDIWLSLAVGGYHAETVPEPLVVSYDAFADSMMTNTDDRIRGVGQFVEKWRPTYVDWFGPEEGERRLQRYFARVIARLAATKLVSGNLGEARRAVGAVFDRSDQTFYNVSVLATLVAESAVKRFAPPALVRRLSALRR